MNFKIKPSKFIDLIESGMIRSGSTSLIDNIQIKLKPTGMFITETTTGSDVAAVILAKKEFFEEYTVPKPTDLVITQEILDRIKEVKNSATFEFDDKSLSVSDGVDTIHAELNAVTEKVFPLPISTTQYGPMLDFNKLTVKEGEKWDEKKTLKDFNIYKTGSSFLKLPKKPSYDVLLKDGELSVSIPYTMTKHEHKISGTLETGKNVTMSVDGDYYTHIVDNMNGEVTIVFDKSKMIFIENNEQYSKTFALATRITNG
jgi:hypothetical protein